MHKAALENSLSPLLFLEAFLLRDNSKEPKADEILQQFDSTRSVMYVIVKLFASELGLVTDEVPSGYDKDPVSFPWSVRALHCSRTTLEQLSFSGNAGISARDARIA
jgi:hypothetical protein